MSVEVVIFAACLLRKDWNESFTCLNWIFSLALASFCLDIILHDANIDLTERTVSICKQILLKTVYHNSEGWISCRKRLLDVTLKKWKSFKVLRKEVKPQRNTWWKDYISLSLHMQWLYVLSLQLVFSILPFVIFQHTSNGSFHHLNSTMSSHGELKNNWPSLIK